MPMKALIYKAPARGQYQGGGGDKSFLLRAFRAALEALRA